VSQELLAFQAFGFSICRNERTDAGF